MTATDDRPAPLAPPDDAARRAYWTEQLELGDAFVQRLVAFPVADCGERLASLPEAAAAAGVEMAFSDSPIVDDLPRVHRVREGLVDDILAIGREMNRRGWILKIEDGFRSLDMQRRLVRKPGLFDAIVARCVWELGGATPAPDFIFRRAIVMVANIPKIGTHMSASAIDISVLRRDDGREVWRGDGYPHISERTPMRSPFVEPEALENRRAITTIMEAHGFMHYPFEFWHYSQGDAMAHLLSGDPRPAPYGPIDWDPRTGAIEPVADAFTPLNLLDVIEREIAAAVSRREPA
jgi:zinc D-Ala-D-Ala dipeptidase